MLNVVILMGRLTKEPLLYEGETPVVSFDLAVDNLGKDAGTTFITCKSFNKVAENVNSYCHKGSKVAIQGRIIQRNYLAKDGSKRNTYEVLADSVEFLDPKEKYEEPEDIQVVDSDKVAPAPKFDPMTGKPLKPAKK